MHEFRKVNGCPQYLDLFSQADNDNTQECNDRDATSVSDFSFGGMSSAHGNGEPKRVGLQILNPDPGLFYITQDYNNDANLIPEYSSCYNGGV